MNCHSCFQVGSLIIHGSHDVKHDDGQNYVMTQSTCKICKAIHEIYVPVENDND